MLAVKRSAGIASQVNLREHISCTSLPGGNETAPEETSPEVQKTGVSVAPLKGHVSLLKVILTNHIIEFFGIRSENPAVG